MNLKFWICQAWTDVPQTQNKISNTSWNKLELQRMASQANDVDPPYLAIITPKEIYFLKFGVGAENT